MSAMKHLLLAVLLAGIGCQSAKVAPPAKPVVRLDPYLVIGHRVQCWSSDHPEDSWPVRKDGMCHSEDRTYLNGLEQGFRDGVCSMSRVMQENAHVKPLIKIDTCTQDEWDFIAPPSGKLDGLLVNNPAVNHIDGAHCYDKTHEVPCLTKGDSK